MFVAFRSRHAVRLVVSIFVLTFCHGVFAQSSSGYSPNPNLYDLSNRAAEIGWLPGESYDTRSGQMNHVMNDVVLKGTGLPIVVTRGIYQGDKRGINLIFPKLKLLNKALNGAPPECNRNHAEAITFHDAGNSESFTKKSSVNPELRHFPDYATHASKNNWIIKCDGATYIAQAPSGIEYIFGKSI